VFVVLLVWLSVGDPGPISLPAVQGMSIGLIAQIVL